MTNAEALEAVSQACAAYRGTLADHQVLQEALALLRAVVLKPDEHNGGGVTEAVTDEEAARA